MAKYSIEVKYIAKNIILFAHNERKKHFFKF